MKLEYSMSARRDFSIYALLIFGLVFAWVGYTSDPKNCDESGRECAPWLVPIGFWSGVLAATASLAGLIANTKWGSSIDVAERRFSWWQTNGSPTSGSISLDDVAEIEVQVQSEGCDRVCFYDRDGVSMQVPKSGIFPCGAEPWARNLADLFPHIKVWVEGG